MSKHLSRRQFLKLSGLAAATAATGFPLSLSTLAQDTALSVMLWGSFIPTNNPLLESLMGDWASRNGVSLDVTFTGFGQLSDTLATAAATGAGPDVMGMLYVRPHQFAEALVDVSDIAESIGERMGGWFDVARESCVVDGVWRAVPFFITAHAMVYREDIFQEAGYDAFPETWEDLLVAGTEIKRLGLPPIGFSLGRAEGDANNFLLSLLWSFGGAVWDEDGNIALDSAETRQAIEFVQQLYNDAMDPSVLEWDDGANNRGFLAGEISATNNASSILWAGRRDKIEFMETTNHASYPAGPAGLVQLAQLVSLGIMNYAQDVDAAKNLIDFIMSEQVWLPLGLDGFAFYYPAFKGLEDNPAMPWNFDPKLSAFKGLPENAKTFGYPGKPSPVASEVAVNFIIIDMFSSVAAGVASTDEAIATAIEQINDLLA
ncbi:MAG: extracellular solute-binding protein [Chloroflexi bacterium]|nr:MAG: extracellular solute-binding protein [Chloroflexota bacterium]